MASCAHAPPRRRPAAPFLPCCEPGAPYVANAQARAQPGASWAFILDHRPGTGQYATAPPRFSLELVVSSRLPQRPRSAAEPLEVVELRRLRQQQPELAPAIDLQMALLDLQRRVEARVPLPACALTMGRGPVVPQPGRALLSFDDLPINWSDARYLLRATADLFVRAQALEDEDHRQLLALSREGHEVEVLVREWYAATATWDPHTNAPAEMPPDVQPFDQLFAVALRPFLVRCAHALAPQLVLTGWHDRRCPVCGGEPELVVITTSGQRMLVCSRCTLQWPTLESVCPFCRNADRPRLTSLSSPDGRYRLDACDVCLRYVKAYDERSAPRPAMPLVDTIATLPLDAVAMQRGYRA